MIKKARIVCFLPVGSITCLCFHGDSHMISSGEDGMLCVWDTNSWDCMKVLRGHK